MVARDCFFKLGTFWLLLIYIIFNKKYPILVHQKNEQTDKHVGGKRDITKLWLFLGLLICLRPGYSFKNISSLIILIYLWIFFENTQSVVLLNICSFRSRRLPWTYVLSEVEGFLEQYLLGRKNLVFVFHGELH